METFPKDPTQVQVQFLTSIVNLFLDKLAKGPQQMIQVFFIHPHYHLLGTHASFHIFLYF